MQLKRPFYKGLLNKGKSRQSLVNLRGQYRVRKRGILEEDSSLGLKGIDILYINLKWLISGKSCTIPCILFYNKYQVLTFALADSRVNTFTLIDTQCAVKLVNFLNVLIEDLPKPIPIYKYNGRVGQPIINILWIYLHIDK
jgi:hypothetical protein